MKFLGLSIVLLILAACGGPELVENPSCCMYDCRDGDRKQWFSMYFGTKEECRTLAAGRCLVDRLEFETVQTEESLNAECKARFTTFTSSSAVP